MRLTRKSKYAVRLLVELALRSGRCPCGAAELARETRMPEAFVGQILRELGRAGIVAGRRGAGGGFRLSVPPAEVSVLAVVGVFDGGVRAPEARSPDEPAAVSGVWEEARAALEGVLVRYTIAGLAAAEEGRQLEARPPFG